MIQWVVTITKWGTLSLNVGHYTNKYLGDHHHPLGIIWEIQFSTNRHQGLSRDTRHSLGVSMLRPQFMAMK